MAFRDYLLSSTVSDTLEVWELKGIVAYFPYIYRCSTDLYHILFCPTAMDHFLYGKTVSALLYYWSTFFIYGMLHTADLGHQTAQRIVQASDPLQSMQEISQNFPSIVSSLSRMKVQLHLSQFKTCLCFSTLFPIHSSKLWSGFGCYLQQYHARTAWQFHQRWNYCKSADGSTWQVIDGFEWCFDQYWGSWSLPVCSTLLPG